jgi:hypothetical protein
VSDLLEGLNIRGRRDDILPILIKKASNYPIASLLIAASVAWLIFSGSKELRFDKTPPNNSPRTKEKARAAQR